MTFIDFTRIPDTGHPRIDAAHRDIAERINVLYELWQDGAEHEELVGRLDLLLHVIGRHFAEEEDIAREAGFAGVDAHAERHAGLMANLLSMVDNVRAADTHRDLTIDVFDLFDTLLYEHEIVDDQDFWLLFHDGAPPEAAAGSQPLILWDQALEIGNAELDEDHRVLADLVNRLGGALGSDAPDAAVGYLLARFLERAEAHFAREERLMAPEHLDGHRRLHTDLLADLRRVIDGQLADGLADERDGQPRDGLPRYLKFWLIDHIRTVDLPHLIGHSPDGAGVRGPEDAEPGAG